ncbi:isoprenyl transferase [Candidatus Riflebacteria bacterium]
MQVKKCLQTTPQGKKATKNESKIDPIPRHIAIVMDGNGRWAEKKGLPRVYGHSVGAKNVKKIVMACCKHNIKYLTLYAFSVQNWHRPKSEVAFLMRLFKKYLKSEREEMKEQDIKFRAMGRIQELSSEIRKQILLTEKETENNTGLNLNLAVNYGGRTEIVDAVNALLKEGIKGGEITEDLLSSYMYLPDLPDPDLIIRTSGEIRLSNFLLWQVAYSEFIILDISWPDFDETALLQSMEEFSLRKRRFGGLS